LILLIPVSNLMFLLAVNPIIGNIGWPGPLQAWMTVPAANCGGALIALLTNLLRLAVVLGGIYALINLIFAGLQFISSAGNPKEIGHAGEKIFQTLIGLFVIAASFLLAALIGLIIFGNAGAILQPVIYNAPGVTC
jgi:hypothetical protein